MPECAGEASFQQVQRQFTAHIRDPEANEAPGDIEDRRMEIYRGLFFRNIEGFIAGAFPVLKSLLGEEHWQGIIRDFIAHHHCQTPYFLEISQEFIRYLREERKGTSSDPPYMVELAHYEWVELALDVADVEPEWSAIQANGDLLLGVPVISPTAWSLSYTYPVHRIGRAWQPETKPDLPTFLIVYRNRDDRVKFMEINAVTARLLELILQDQEGRTGQGALAQLAMEIRQDADQRFFTFGLDILAKLQATGIILGVRGDKP